MHKVLVVGVVVPSILDILDRIENIRNCLVNSHMRDAAMVLH